MQKEKELQITLRNVSKKYGEHSILENISLDIYKGDFVCIIWEEWRRKNNTFEYNWDIRKL